MYKAIAVHLNSTHDQPRSEDRGGGLQFRFRMGLIDRPRVPLMMTH